ncbi:MAG: putative caspase-like protein, partial [Myxococcota bacterium]
MLIPLLLSTASASDLWPDLSSSPSGSSGSRDAAVVVAIQDYAVVGDIAGAQSNGLDWYTYFTDGRGIPASRVTLLADAEGVKEDIEGAVETARAAVRSGGTLWFVFIGHGAPNKDGTDGLLVGWDTRQNARSIYDRGISQSDLLGALSQGSQAETMVIIDACFSGRGSTGDALVEDLMPLIPESVTISGDVTVLSAGQSDEFAGPLPGAARPAFSYLVLGALRGWGDANGDGQVSAMETIDYSREALAALPIGRS